MGPYNAFFEGKKDVFPDSLLRSRAILHFRLRESSAAYKALFEVENEDIETLKTGISGTLILDNQDLTLARSRSHRSQTGKREHSPGLLADKKGCSWGTSNYNITII